MNAPPSRWSQWSENLGRWTAVASRLWGGRRRPDYLISRWIFLRLLGVIYLSAFVSMGVQIVGLVGEKGILPLKPLLEQAFQQIGAKAYYHMPTLCWFSVPESDWLPETDAMLQFLCWGGAVLAILLIADVAPQIVLALLWIFYLSLTVAGQSFTSFQWDVLLLETGLLAIFFAPSKFLPGPSRERRPSTPIRWLLWLLLFKLMFLSGITKILSGDATWANWTALLYHYETQPIPTPTAWWFHWRAEWFQQASVVGMYFVELVVPFFIFAPPRWKYVRPIACGLLIGLQLLILFTGNYGFFNWLTIVLSLLLLEDAVWRKLLPGALMCRVSRAAERPREWLARRLLSGFVFVVILFFSSVAFITGIHSTSKPRKLKEPPRWYDSVSAPIQPFHSINHYGLFRRMTITRPELVLEGSNDGRTWKEYEFRYKAGDLGRPPPWVAPHMPRLDWQMWFAALRMEGIDKEVRRRGLPDSVLLLDYRPPRNDRYWLLFLLKRLHEGEPKVLALFEQNPFPDAPPKVIRVVMYQYQFTTPKQRAGRDQWWSRDEKRKRLVTGFPLPPARQGF